MLKEKISFEKREAVMLTVDLSGRTIEEYALAWLKLTNNAREYNDIIWKISNNSGNNVYVICNPNNVDVVRDFCTNIVSMYDEKQKEIHYVGKVLKEEKIEVGIPIYEYESTFSCDDERWDEDIDNCVWYWLDTEVF